LESAGVLVNITNDAWFGNSAAPYQLLAMAAMRSVETHTPMVRVANTGVSAVISPTGRIIGATQLFTRTTQIETVEWKGTRTFYTRFGDVFAELCFVLLVIGLLWATVRTLVVGDSSPPA
jgi:apolipoprotein N-acyltransferase